MPAGNFSTIENFHTITQQNYVVEAKLLKQHNTAVSATLNAHPQPQHKLFYSFVYRTLS